MKLNIATVNKRSTVLWKNKILTWGQLVEKLSNTTRTQESYKEYMSSTKKMQADIKDVGGFVGGYLDGGRRKVGSIRHRQVVTLDIDECPKSGAELLFDICFKLPYELVVHSTHKHSPAKPRLRIVIPLDRPVSPDEYEAIARMLGSLVNIEDFDPTTFQPSRFMYWPSTSADGEYLFEHQEADICVADEILGMYVDWTDLSAWPRIASEPVRIATELKSAEDPREKTGVVGAFCRAFDVREVIARFIPNAYEEAEGGRYTYTDGSSQGGGIVYSEDLFFYSHHGTDPAGMLLSNAFDLVRIHKFGNLDLDKEVSMAKRESFMAMCDFAISLSEVKAELRNVDNPVSKAVEQDFAAVLEDNWLGEEIEDIDDIWGNDGEVEVVDQSPKKDLHAPDFRFELNSEVNADNWQNFLQYMPKKQGGGLKPTITNMKLIIIFDEKLRGRIRLNDFEHSIFTKGSFPWNADPKEREWEDSDMAGLKEYMESNYDIYHITKTKDALVLAATFNRHHPVINYLDSLTWDGVERLDTLFIDHMGAVDNIYTRMATRKAFTACVKRIKEPGCKMDYVLTLVGGEGLRKSAILAEMGGEWFSDTFTTVEGTRAFEQIQGGWLIEIPELAGFNRSETNTIKSFVTKRKDRFRGAYKENTVNCPRQCVFFASTNDLTFLKGYTGNRRFWPILVTKRAESAKVASKPGNNATMVIGLEVDQLWAEAVHRYKQKEPLFLDTECEAIAKNYQDSFSDTDDRTGLVEEYLNMPVPSNWDNIDYLERQSYFNTKDFAEGTVQRENVCAFEIWVEALGMSKKEYGPKASKEVFAMVTRCKGWEYVSDRQYFKGYGSQRYFKKTVNVDILG